MEKIIDNNGIELKKIIYDLQNSFSFPENFPNINKKTLRHYDFNEVYEYTIQFFENIDDNLEILIKYLKSNLSEDIKFTYRFKTEESFKMKWKKYLIFGKKFYKACNDLLGVRFIVKCNERELKEKLKIFYNDENCKIINFYENNKKTNDDGYRGIHIYFRYNKNSFPIEFQFWTRKDAILHFYTHEVIYKSTQDKEFWNYSKRLREWLDTIPESPANLEVDYVNYLYDIFNKEK